MELKLHELIIIFHAKSRFNRTFMELKRKHPAHQGHPRAVLIAPLWN